MLILNEILLHIGTSDMTSPPSSSLHSTPFNASALLKIKILSWSQQTGFPVCIRVRVADRTFNLHKLPLTSKSGYFREKLKDSNEVELPSNFPGGADTFETIALLIYGSSSSSLVDPLNVAALRCAAEFLLMREDYNLCERFDIYLNQVVLQSWNDTLIVLQTCRSLLPWAEDLLIVTRCIETLAFMACMEILDPERRTEQPPLLTLQPLTTSWTDAITRDLWIQDVIALPLAFFKRLIASLRRQGMREKYVTPILLLYAHKWVISATRCDDDSRKKLQCVVDMLPAGGKTSRVIPVGFYLSLLSTSMELRLRSDSVEKLQNQTASLLHLAKPQDLDGIELSVMERIFTTFFSCCKIGSDSDSSGFVVAELWDLYLNQIAADSELGCKKFVALIQTVPALSRPTHDNLYRAINTFLQSHPNLSQEEKGVVCKHLNCQKLSQQVCIEAVQNEVMPLRLMVQALLVQQLNTQQVFNHSFRYNGGEFSGSLSGESPFMQGGSAKDSSGQMQGPEPYCQISRKDYESTSFRIENLEKELMSLKRSLERKNGEKIVSKKVEAVTRRMRKKKKKKNQSTLGQVGSCIGSVNFASHRKYAGRLLKLLQRLSLFGRGRSNT